MSAVLNKENWGSDEILFEIIQNFMKSYPDKYKEFARFTTKKVYRGVTANQNFFINLCSAFPDEMEYFVKEYFTVAVLNEKLTWEKDIYEIKFDIAKYNYDNLGGDFLSLSKREQDRLINDVMLPPSQFEAIVKVRYDAVKKIIDLNIGRIKEMEKTGQFKNGYNCASVLMFLNTIEQTDYVSDQVYMRQMESFVPGFTEYYCKEHGIASPVPIGTESTSPIVTADTEVDVYCFQSANIGSKNFLTFKGAIGAKDGMCVVSKKTYERIIAAACKEDNGKYIFDSKIAGQLLGNVPLTENVVVIHQKVKVKDLKPSFGKMSTAYFGEFTPGFTTIGGFDNNGNRIDGVPECVVPQIKLVDEKGSVNTNVDTILYFGVEITPEKARSFFASLISSNDAIEIISQLGYLNKNTSEYEKKLQELHDCVSEDERKFLSYLLSKKDKWIGAPPGKSI